VQGDDGYLSGLIRRIGRYNVMAIITRSRVGTAFSAVPPVLLCPGIIDQLSSSPGGGEMESLAEGDPRQVGAYQLRYRLGAGGMGRVFLGFSPAGRAVAVKVVHPELARDEAFISRFRREVQAATAVSGAYTAPVVAAGPDDDPPWLATAFVDGPSLAEAVAQSGPFPEPAVWRLAGGLAEALQAVHACGLVHRDLKPTNILLAADGPRVIDFGISRALEGTTVMTGSSMVVGTPGFMSPEQAQALPVGPASDVFALGSVITFAATGTAPFETSQPVATAYRIVHAEPDLSALPARLRELVSACLAKAPADRPSLAQILDTASAAFPAAPVAAFWPDPVAGLVRSWQASFRAQAPPHKSPTTTAGASPGQGDMEVTRTAWRGHAAPDTPRSPDGDRPGRHRWPLIAGVAAVIVIGSAAAVLALSGVFQPTSPRPHSPPSSAPPTHAPATSSAATVSLPVVKVCTAPAIGCIGFASSASMKTEPVQIVTSADGSGYVNGITWTSWGQATANGTGTLNVNNCTPNCAAGTYTGYPATITLSGLVVYRSGTDAYSRMVVSAPTSPYGGETFTSGLVP
jgi:serine/threonine protein kinase